MRAILTKRFTVIFTLIVLFFPGQRPNLTLLNETTGRILGSSLGLTEKLERQTREAKQQGMQPESQTMFVGVILEAATRLAKMIQWRASPVHCGYNDLAPPTKSPGAAHLSSLIPHACDLTFTNPRSSVVLTDPQAHQSLMPLSLPHDLRCPFLPWWLYQPDELLHTLQDPVKYHLCKAFPYSPSIQCSRNTQVISMV